MTKYTNTGTEPFSIRGVEFLPGVPTAAPEGLPESKMAFILARCTVVEVKEAAPVAVVGGAPVASLISRKLSRSEVKDVKDSVDTNGYACAGQLTFACLVTGGTGVFCDNVLIDTVHVAGVCGD